MKNMIKEKLSELTTSVRYILIDKLAGSDIILINVTISSKDGIVAGKNKIFVKNCVFKGFKTAVTLK